MPSHSRLARLPGRPTVSDQEVLKPVLLHYVLGPAFGFLYIVNATVVLAFDGDDWFW